MNAFELRELLPKLDCGLCGNPVCMTLARKTILGTQNPGDCRFVSKESLNSINKMLPKEEMVRRHPHPNLDQDVLEIHPCTEDGKVTLETQLKSKFMNLDYYSDFFDQVQLCDSLNDVKISNKMSCSPKMGYALLEISGKRVHIFKTGKIIMRRAEDREDALSTFSNISRVLLPARICSCGNMLADCFGGACEGCATQMCAAHLDFIGYGEKEDQGTFRTVADVLTEYSESRNSNLTANFEYIKNIESEVRNLDEAVRSRDKGRIGEIKDEIAKMVAHLHKSSMEIILENESVNHTIIALTQYGLARDLGRVGDALASLDSAFDDSNYNDGIKIFFDACDTFVTVDLEASKVIGDRYEKFISGLGSDVHEAPIAKVAANGFYISRILGKPVPNLISSENENGTFK